MFIEEGIDAANNRHREQHVKSRHAVLSNGDPGVVVSCGGRPIVLTQQGAHRLADQIIDTLQRIKDRQ